MDQEELIQTRLDAKKIAKRKNKLINLILKDPVTLFSFVKSSNLLTISYNIKRKTMDIEFKQGAIYRYYKVNIRLYNNLIKAKSKGKYFWRRVRRKPYRYRRLR